MKKGRDGEMQRDDFELPDPESFVLRRVGICRLRLLSPSPVCFESQKLTQLN